MIGNNRWTRNLQAASKWIRAIRCRSC